MINNPNLQYFLNTEPTKGIIRIFNIQSEKSLLLKSNNIIEDTKNIRFQLDLGMYSNEELQKEYSEIGLELYSIEPILIQENNNTLESLLIEATRLLKEKNIEFYK